MSIQEKYPFLKGKSNAFNWNTETRIQKSNYISPEEAAIQYKENLKIYNETPGKQMTAKMVTIPLPQIWSQECQFLIQYKNKSFEVFQIKKGKSPKATIKKSLGIKFYRIKSWGILI